MEKGKRVSDSYDNRYDDYGVYKGDENVTPFSLLAFVLVVVSLISYFK